MSLTAFLEICVVFLFFVFFVIFLVLYSTVHAPLFRWCTLKTEVKYTNGFLAAYLKLVVCNINCL